MKITRRDFLKGTAGIAAATALGSALQGQGCGNG